MAVKKFLPFIFIIPFFFFTNACVVGFSNSQNHVPIMFSKIYVPSANDASVYSGNSSRLSFAIRNVLANRTDIELSSLHDARLALQIKVMDRSQTIAAVDSCNNPGTTTVASGAYACSLIHPELVAGMPGNLPTSLNQPAVSPSSESLYLVVDVKAVDLNKGNVLWGKRYYAGNISPVVFNEIGDPGDNRTMTSMAQTPGMHGLRYQEAVDNAVSSFSNAIASDLSTALFSALPQQ